MIIVSQDKTELINFDNIVRLTVSVNTSGQFLIEAHNFCDDFETVIGSYETEERAKEVLADVFDTRAIFEFYKYTDKVGKEMLENRFLKMDLVYDVYEMPKE